MNWTKTENEREKTPKVLVVDDNQQNLELLQAYLEDVDCQALCRIPRYDPITDSFGHRSRYCHSEREIRARRSDQVIC